MTGESPPAVRVRRRVALPVQTSDGVAWAEAVSFTGLSGGGPDPGPEHLALVFGAPVIGASGAVPLVRVHSECLTGDVLGSLRCDCGAQLRESLDLLARDGGVLLYLRQEGRGIGLYAKLDAYAVQSEHGLDTFAANRAIGRGADERDYGVAAAMLGALGISRIALLSGNPAKRSQLESLGVEVVSFTPTALHATGHNLAYLTAKREVAGHRFR